MMNVPEHVRNFIVGQPSEALIPRQMLDAAFTRAISANIDPYIYQYASSQGPATLRNDLAAFLSKTGVYAQNIQPENLCISFGNSQGISAAVTSLSKPGDVAIVEDPTYFLIGKILTDAGLSVVPCPVNSASGLDMKTFKSLVEQHQPRIVYVNPIHQNPTGSRMTVIDREQLIRLSIQKNFYIISDEPYVLLSFQALEAMDESFSSLGRTADRLGPNEHRNLVCCGSFSKILTPGLRCGWLSGHEDTICTIAAHGALASGGGPPPLISETVRQLITRNELSAHLDFLRDQLSTRLHAMQRTLSSYSGRIEFIVPQGGYFVWVRVPNPSFNADMFHMWLRDQKISIRFLPSQKCSAIESGHTIPNAIRLAFSFYTPEEIESGITDLLNALDRYLLDLGINST